MVEYRYVPEYFVESPEVWKLSLDDQLILAKRYETSGKVLSLPVLIMRDREELKDQLKECFYKYFDTAEALHILEDKLSQWLPDFLVFTRKDGIYFQIGSLLPLKKVLEVIRVVRKKFEGEDDLPLFDYRTTDIKGFRVEVERHGDYVVINVFIDKPPQELIKVDFDSFLREYPNPVIPVEVNKMRTLFETLLDKATITRPLVDASIVVSEIESKLGEIPFGEEKEFESEISPYIPADRVKDQKNFLIWSFIYELLEGKSRLSSEIEEVIKQNVGKLAKLYKGKGRFVITTKDLSEGVLNRILLETVKETNPKYIDIIVEPPNFVIVPSYEATYGPNFFIQIDEEALYRDYPDFKLTIFPSISTGEKGVVTTNEELFFKAVKYLRLNPDFVDELEKVVSTIFDKLRNESKTVH